MDGGICFMFYGDQWQFLMSVNFGPVLYMLPYICCTVINEKTKEQMTSMQYQLGDSAVVQHEPIDFCLWSHLLEKVWRNAERLN